MNTRTRLFLVVCMAIVCAMLASSAMAQVQKAATTKAATKAATKAGTKAATKATKGEEAPAAERQQRLTSPVINNDKTVTFQLLAPEAKSLEVQLQVPGSGIVKIQMNKDDQGIWKGNTPEPLKPGLYFYHLMLDGVPILDPGATWYKGDSIQWGVILDVPGDKPADYNLRENIPHGITSHTWFMSSVLKEQRAISVYTPPSHAGSSKKYPVLYLLHGSGGNETTWIKRAMMDIILDNWIADKTINDIVVVITSNRMPSTRNAEAQGSGANILADYFTKDVMPYIEKNYRVETDRTKTAVSGFSMGGGQTLNLALSKPDKFGAFAVLSGALSRTNATEQYPILKDGKKMNELFPVIYIGAGTDEPLITGATSLHESMTEAGINHKFMTGPGAHEMKTDWGVLKAFLADFTKGK